MPQHLRHQELAGALVQELRSASSTEAMRPHARDGQPRRLQGGARQAAELRRGWDGQEVRPLRQLVEEPPPEYWEGVGL